MLHVDGVGESLETFAGEPDAIRSEMETRAERDGFPTVGHEVGMYLAWLVEATNARRVFECGSGYGYSAYWMAPALPSDGSIVLTEIDHDELADAKTYFERAGLSDLARFEQGDALEVLNEEDVAYDLILLDHENDRYVEGFDIAASSLTAGGTIVADNVLHSWEFGPEEIAAGLRGGDVRESSESYEGIRSYLAYIADRDDFRSALLPLGEGISVSTHVADSAV